MRRAQRGALLLFVLVLLGACADDRVLELRTWELSVLGSNAAPVQVTLPTHLDDGRVPDRDLTFELRASVELPAALRGQDLRLSLPAAAALARLFVDGHEAAEEQPSKLARYRRRSPIVWLIDPAATRDGRLELVLRVDHRWSQSAWLGAPLRLAQSGADVHTYAVSAFNLILSAAAFVLLAQVGLTSLLVYFVDRRRRAYLWFAIQALTASYYPVYVSGAAQLLLGHLEVPVLAINLVVAITASIQFTHEFFELSAPTPWWWRVCGLACVVPLLTPDPYVITAVAGRVVVAFLAAGMLYQLWVCGRLAVQHEDRRSAVYQLASWISLGAFCAPDLTYWLGWGELLGGARSANVGLAAFGMWLSLILGQRHILSLGRADHLNEELSHRVQQLQSRGREIELLNAELRRQVGERSSQLYAALALAATRRGATPRLAVGSIVQERYRIESTLGSGGMGTVYEVTRLSDEKRFALKIAHELHGEALARLAREAQVAATVHHPNVVSIVDVDVDPSGLLYLVLELVKGTTLRAQRHRYGDVDWALSLLHQLALGLDALHRAGIIHRDLKPDNVLLTDELDEPHVKITDFGIALNPAAEVFVPTAQPVIDTSGERSLTRMASERKPARNPDDTELVDAVPAPTTASISRRPASDAVMLAEGAGEADWAQGLLSEPPPALDAASAGSRHAANLTQTGRLPGTPAYMAPELIAGRHMLSPAADIFAFGVIAFELLTGSQPFERAPALTRLEGADAPAARRLTALWPDAPAQLAEMIERCVRMDLFERPSAAEVAACLRAAVPGEKPSRRQGHQA